MSKNIRPILIILICLLLSGCWDHLELETLDLVLGLGVDAVEPDFDIITELVKVKGAQETEFEPVVLTTKGRTFFTSGRSLTKPAGIRMRWAHAQVFIVSEEVARENMLAAIELIMRDPDVRTSILLMVAKDCTVHEIFTSKPPITDFVSDHLRNLVELRDRIPFFYSRKLWEFRQTLALSGINGVLPTVQLVQEGEDKVPVLDGSAVFKGSHMVGWLSGLESRIFAMLMGERDRGSLVVKTEVGGERGEITYEIRGNQVKITPLIEGPRLGFSVALQLQVDLPELGSLDIEYEDPKVEAALEREINILVQGQILNLIGRVQREFGADIFGFGLLLKKRHPRVWRAYAENWDDTFAALDISAEVSSRIVSTGVLSKPLRMRE